MLNFVRGGGEINLEDMILLKVKELDRLARGVLLKDDKLEAYACFLTKNFIS